MSVKLLGEYIRKARMDKGYSLRTVAEKAQISPAQLSKIENGLIKSSPKHETLYKLAYALNVDKFDLFALVGRTPGGSTLGQLVLPVFSNYPTDKLYTEREVDEYIKGTGIKETGALYETAQSPAVHFDDIARKLVELKDPDLSEEDTEFMVDQIAAMYKIAKRSLSNRKKMNGGDE